MIIFAEARLWRCTSTGTNRGEKYKRRNKERKERDTKREKERVTNIKWKKSGERREGTKKKRVK